MNDFTKEELQILLNDHWSCGANYPGLYNKIKFMISNDSSKDGIQIVASGELLFHNKDCASGILPEIKRHLELCLNDDDSKCFSIDWKIFFGKKFGV
jgi:hypothetical protein